MNRWKKILQFVIPGLIFSFTPLLAESPIQQQARAILQGADRLSVVPRLTELVKNLRPDDFPALVEELRQIPEGLDRSEPGRVVFAAWAALDGPSALEAALRGPLPEHEAYAAALSWSLVNPEALIVYIQSITDPEQRAFATRFLAATWLTISPHEALRKSDSLPDAVMRSAAMAHTTRTLIQSPLPGHRKIAADWIARHTQADYAAMAAGIIAADWIVADPREAIAWVKKLPPGPVQNQAIYELAGSWAGLQPQAAYEWVKAMPVSEGRRRALEYIESFLQIRR